jgi:hypothetical protein
MPISIGDLAKRSKRVTFDFEIGGKPEPVTVSYLIGKMTPALESEIREMADAPFRQQELTARVVSDLLESWDVTGEDGKTPYPTDFDALQSLGVDFLGAVLLAIMQDIRPGEATGATTPATS